MRLLRLADVSQPAAAPVTAAPSTHSLWQGQPPAARMRACKFQYVIRRKGSTETRIRGRLLYFRDSQAIKRSGHPADSRTGTRIMIRGRRASFGRPPAVTSVIGGAGGRLSGHAVPRWARTRLRATPCPRSGGRGGWGRTRGGHAGPTLRPTKPPAGKASSTASDIRVHPRSRRSARWLRG